MNNQMERYTGLRQVGKGRAFTSRVHQPGSSPNPVLWDLGIFMQSSSYGHDQSLTPFIAFLPSQETGGRADHPKLLFFFSIPSF